MGGPGGAARGEPGIRRSSSRWRLVASGLPNATRSRVGTSARWPAQQRRWHAWSDECGRVRGALGRSRSRRLPAAARAITVPGPRCQRRGAPRCCRGRGSTVA